MREALRLTIDMLLDFTELVEADEHTAARLGEMRYNLIRAKNLVEGA